MTTKITWRRVAVEGLDSIFDGDLADVQNLTKYNDRVSYLLIVIDVFSHYLLVVPLENKMGRTIVDALKSICKQGRKSNIIRFDKGSEFNSKWVKSYLSSEKIAVHFTQNQTKGNYAERVIRTMKGMIFRYFTANQMYQYINILQVLVFNYNNRPYRSLGQWTPASITKQNEDEARYVMYLIRKQLSPVQRPYKYKMMDKVRISHLKHPFLRDC